MPLRQCLISVAKDETLALTSEERLKLQAAPVKEVPDVYPAATVVVMQAPERMSTSRRIGDFHGSHWSHFRGINMYALNLTDS